MRHQLVFVKRGRPIPGHSKDTLFFGMYPWHDSAALVWPGRKDAVPGSEESHFIPAPTEEDPVHVAIMDWEDWDCHEVKYRSWAWQKKHLPKAWLRTRAPAIRMFLGPKQPVKVAAAKKCFWKLTFTKLLRIAKMLKIAVEEGMTLFALLLMMVTTILKIDELEAMSILALRWSDWELELQFHEVLCGVDAAIEVLDFNDHKEVKAEQAQEDSSEEERKAFMRDLNDKLLELSKAKKGDHVPKKAKHDPPRKYPTEMPQTEANNWIPPGASIWRGFRRGEWCGHMPPFRRVSATWAAYTENGARKEVTKMLWKQALSLEGKPNSVCPIEF